MEHKFPTTLFVDLLPWPCYDVVGYDIDLLVIRSTQVLEDSADDGFHAGRKHNGRDVVLQRPLEEVVKVGVQLDVLDE